MTIAIARLLLHVPATESSWDVIARNQDAFIWDDNGFHVEKWNSIAGKGPDAAEVKVDFVEGKGEILTYKGRTLHAPFEFDRIDGLISIHSLAKLVSADSELRYCVDTWHYSDKAFLALSPAQWSELEGEFGQQAVDYRFLRLADDFKNFLEAMNSDDLCRDYGVSDALAIPEEPGSAFINFPAYNAVHFDWINVQSSNQQPNQQRIAELIDRTIGTREVHVHVRLPNGKTGEELCDREGLISRLLPFVGHADLRLADRDFAAFVVIARSAVATGWRTEKAAPIRQSPKNAAKPFWKFWQKK